MGSEFNFDLDHIEQIVAKLTGLSGYISDHLDQIDNQVAALTGSAWASIASEAYQAAHSQWSTGAREFVDGIRDMSDAAKNAGIRYNRAIDLNSKMLQGGPS